MIAFQTAVEPEVDKIDVTRPRAFFTAMHEHNRPAFDAHRAWCDALLGG